MSLADHPLELRSGGKTLWSPREAGLRFAPVPNAPPPAVEPRQRLTQMRQIARRFQVIDRWGLKDPSDWELRLLPTPLYRYASTEADVTDGALFGYVLTTSPEAALLLEAYRDGDRLAWRYGVSRCTRFEVRFSLDDQSIAEFPRLESWPAHEVYFHDPIPMPDYPFRREGRDGKPE